MQNKPLKGDRYFVRMSKGELAVETLTKFLNEQEVHFGYLTAIGALTDPIIGYYDTRSKEYLWKDLTGTYEVVSMIGNVAGVDGKSFLHTHLVLSDDEYKTYGGHLKEGMVGGTLEVMIEKFEGSIGRVFDDETGLKLLELTS